MLFLIFCLDAMEYKHGDNVVMVQLDIKYKMNRMHHQQFSHNRYMYEYLVFIYSYLESYIKRLMN